MFFFISLHTTYCSSSKTHVIFIFIVLKNVTALHLLLLFFEIPLLLVTALLLFMMFFEDPKVYPPTNFPLHLQRPTKFQPIVDSPCFNLLHFNPPLLLFLQKPTKPTKLGQSLLLLQGINFSIFI